MPVLVGQHEGHRQVGGARRGRHVVVGPQSMAVSWNGCRPSPSVTSSFRVLAPAYGLMDRVWFNRRTLGSQETLMPATPRSSS
jgi:hypothetical protein